MDDTINMFGIICDKYNKKVKNKQSNLCKELESCTLNQCKVQIDSLIFHIQTIRLRIIGLILRTQKNS